MQAVRDEINREQNIIKACNTNARQTAIQLQTLLEYKRVVAIQCVGSMFQEKAAMEHYEYIDQQIKALLNI